MANIEQISTITLFVPLLLGIVAQLSSLARDSVDEAEKWDQPPLLLPFENSGFLPNLGRLNYLHTTNYLLLLLCFILVVAMEPAEGPLVKNLLGVMVLLVWLQLPLLEVDEYAAIVEKKRVGWRSHMPTALYVHLVATIAIVVYVVALFPEAKMLTTVDLFSPEPATVQHAVQPLHQVGMGVLLVVAVLGFLFVFQQEVKAVDDD